MGRTCGATDTTGNKCSVKIRLLKEIAFPSEGVIVMIIQGYNWVLSFETGQVMMWKKKKISPCGFFDSVQLYDNHLFTVAAQKGSYFRLIKIQREWERADKGSPAASPQTDELEWSRFWMSALLENNREDKLAALNCFTNGLWAFTSTHCYLQIKTCRDKSFNNVRGGKESESYYSTWLIFIFFLKIGNVQDPFKPKQFGKGNAVFIQHAFLLIVMFFLNCSFFIVKASFVTSGPMIVSENTRRYFFNCIFML